MADEATTQADGVTETWVYIQHETTGARYGVRRSDFDSKPVGPNSETYAELGFVIDVDADGLPVDEERRVDATRETRPAGRDAITPATVKVDEFGNLIDESGDAGNTPENTPAVALVPAGTIPGTPASFAPDSPLATGETVVPLDGTPAPLGSGDVVDDGSAGDGDATDTSADKPARRRTPKAD